MCGKKVIPNTHRNAIGFGAALLAIACALISCDRPNPEALAATQDRSQQIATRAPEPVEAGSELMDGELIETAAPSAATTTRVEPPSPQLLEAWGPLSTLAGRYWVLVDQGAAQHLRYEWEEAGAALTFSGLDRDGNVLAGRFMIDPATREMAGLSIFRGEAYEQNVVIEGTAFTVTTTSGPEQTRARYVRAGIGGFRVEREVFRGNRWRPTRTQSLNVASASIVEALDWRARSAEREAAEARAREELFERRPGFFSRLQTAVQDGLTAGVEEGVRERTRSAITGDESGAEYEAVPLEEDQETDLDKE